MYNLLTMNTKSSILVLRSAEFLLEFESIFFWGEAKPNQLSQFAVQHSSAPAARQINQRAQTNFLIINFLSFVFSLILL